MIGSGPVKDSRSRRLIAINDPAAVRRWSKHLKVTKDELQCAIGQGRQFRHRGPQTDRYRQVAYLEFITFKTPRSDWYVLQRIDTAHRSGGCAFS
jgi:hypothetical protein